MSESCDGKGFVHARASVVVPAANESLLDIEGAACGACVSRIESALRAIPGVGSATFDLLTRRARVRHGDGVSPAALDAAIARAGYKVHRGAASRDLGREHRRALWRTGLAGLAMMQVMMFAYPTYVADPGTLDWDVERLLALASLAVTLPVLLFCATPIWRSALSALRAHRVNMDVSVSLGLGAAFLASLPATAFGGTVYYDSITMFVFFLSFGRALEARALAATVGSEEALAQLLPRTAVRLRDGGHEAVDPANLVPGDRVWIACGEAAPADCTLLEGATDFNEALLTGESAPAAKRAGDAILAGSLNLAAPVACRVERTGEEQTLAVMRRLIEQASARKPRWAQLADQAAGWFIAIVLCLSVLAAAYWLWADAPRALPIVVAILVATCPCALSLATPVALATSARALARQGILVTSGAAIETLAAVDHVVFDKTGTLTTGRMRISAVDTFGTASRDECLRRAASLEHAMPHPLAHALVAAYPGALPATQEVKAEPGRGVEAVIDGKRHRIGSADYCAALAGSPPPFATDGSEPLAALACEGEWLAAIRFDDTLRPEAAVVVQRLRDLGCAVTLLSGDRPEVVARIARSARIADAQGREGPADKVAAIDALIAKGATVAMVGDGVNDAPVLARASIAIAMGQGAAAARAQADLVVLNPSLEAIADAIETARLTRRVIAQNLAWAAGYNAVVLPLAVTGLLAPWMASLGMSASSLLVVVNALRIARVRLDGNQGAAPGARENPGMEILYLLVPLGVLAALSAGWAFWAAAEGGQFEALEEAGAAGIAEGDGGTSHPAHPGRPGP